MPWKLVRQGDKVCVVKSSTDEVLKCYDKRKEALAYLRALYANVPESKDKEKK